MAYITPSEGVFGIVQYSNWLVRFLRTYTLRLTFTTICMDVSGPLPESGQGHSLNGSIFVSDYLTYFYRVVRRHNKVFSILTLPMSSRDRAHVRTYPSAYYDNTTKE